MGSRHEVELCGVLVEEYFGSSVAAVASSLLKEPGQLGQIVHRMRGKASPLQVRKCLVILEQHGLIRFGLESNLRVSYSGVKKTMLALARAPRCCLIAKTLYGAIAEVICEELFCHGRLTCSDTLRRVAAKTDHPVSEIKVSFTRLAESQFICRLPPKDLDVKGCPTFAEQFDAYVMPDIVMDNVRDGGAGGEEGTRKRKAAAGDADANILWRLNVARFDRHIRDEMVLEKVAGGGRAAAQTASAEHNCVQTVRALLKVNEVRATSAAAAASFPISVYDIINAVKDNELGLEKKDVEVALKMLVDEGQGMVRRSGDSGGGIYVVDYERVVSLLSQHHVESMIREQFEGRAVRIFRLLLAKGHLEEEQMEKLAMMGAKETRDLLYALLGEGYVTQRPVAKTNDFAPARTFYLYHVNMQQTVKALVEFTCKSLRNLILRRHHEERENKSVLDREQKLETITEQINADENLDEATKQQQIAEVEELYMGAADRKTLDAYKKAKLALQAAELELERTLFTLYYYLDFASRHC